MITIRTCSTTRPDRGQLRHADASESRRGSSGCHSSRHGADRRCDPDRLQRLSFGTLSLRCTSSASSLVAAVAAARNDDGATQFRLRFLRREGNVEGPRAARPQLPGRWRSMAPRRGSRRRSGLPNIRASRLFLRVVPPATGLAEATPSRLSGLRAAGLSPPCSTPGLLHAARLPRHGSSSQGRLLVEREVVAGHSVVIADPSSRSSSRNRIGGSGSRTNVAGAGGGTKDSGRLRRLPQRGSGPFPADPETSDS